MNLELGIDTTSVASYLQALQSDQIPFAASRAINRIAIAFQEAQRAHQRSIFEIRRPAFVDRAVKIKPFSNKKTLAARVMIDPPGGAKRADIIGKFEDDTQKVPFRGTRLAIPTDNVPRTGGVIQKQWRPRALNLRPHGSGSRALPGRGHMVLAGDRHTFAILRPGGRGMIFERDHGDVIPLYTLVPRVRIRPNLQFGQNARRIVNQVGASHFARSFDEAIRTARIQGPSFMRLAGAVGRLSA